jgi:DNA-binding MarR family transcriptional regulator
MLARVMERSSLGLSLPQYRILSLVARGDERATVLAGRLALTKPTVSAIVDTLVERGVLERRAVEGDRRSTQLVVTDAGRTALAQSEAAMADELGRLLDQVAQRDAVLSALAELDTVLRSEWQERVAARLTAEPAR